MEKNRRQFLKNLAGLSGLAASVVPGMSSAAKANASAGAQIEDIRLANNNGYVRLVFDLDGMAQFIQVKVG